jgi:hypothetical protein
MAQRYKLNFMNLAALLLLVGGSVSAEDLFVLKPNAFAHHVVRFNGMENENRVNYISNAESWAWMQANIPFFECPDREVEEIYYFRWWSMRKHLHRLSAGFVFTEFITNPNPISSALGHHVQEGRWLRNGQYIDDYVLYWLRGHDGKSQPNLHNYSQWLAYALYQRFLVTKDSGYLVPLLDDLVQDYHQWERERQLESGLFWQYDVRDAMEESISGSRTKKNVRPTINSYMYGNAVAIASIARMADQPALARDFEQEASELKRLVQSTMWDSVYKFFKVRLEGGGLSQAREEIGFIPWYFSLPDAGYEGAWAQLTDPSGFLAPFGITTAERRHPLFRSHGCCKCEWDGAVWPFATSQTLTALANVLRDYRQSLVSSRNYFDQFMTYVHSQHFDGLPYIGEYLDEKSGRWLKDRQERSRYYNHSTFADLLISGIVGLRPRADNVVEIHPLLPPNTWEWFCLDGVMYHGQTLTVMWDLTGNRYGRGKGLRVFANGRLVAHSRQLGKVSG